MILVATWGRVGTPATRDALKMEWITTSTILVSLGDYSNRAAWERFTDRCRPPVLRFVRGMGLSEVDAEDAAQGTLLAFAEGFRKGQYDRSKGRLSSWLFGIAFRQALNKRRSLVRRAVGPCPRLAAGVHDGDAAAHGLTADRHTG